MSESLHWDQAHECPLVCLQAASGYAIMIPVALPSALSYIACKLPLHPGALGIDLPFVTQHNMQHTNRQRGSHRGSQFQKAKHLRGVYLRMSRRAGSSDISRSRQLQSYNRRCLRGLGCIHRRRSSQIMSDNFWGSRRPCLATT